MRPQRFETAAGFTRVDVAVMAALIALAIGLALATPGGRSARAERIACVENLKKLGLAVRIAASDADFEARWQSWKTNSFAPGFDEPAAFFGSFSNHLASPRLLICPSDRERAPAASFTNLASRNLSYFANLSADFSRPQDILMGDRNVIADGVPAPSGRLPLTNVTTLTWSKAMHGDTPNLLLADGSVQQISASRLNQHLRALGPQAWLFLIP